MEPSPELRWWTDVAGVTETVAALREAGVPNAEALGVELPL